MKAIVLAAGKGTRLQTENCDLPKVLRTALGKPLLGLRGSSWSTVGWRRQESLVFPSHGSTAMWVWPFPGMEAPRQPTRKLWHLYGNTIFP